MRHSIYISLIIGLLYSACESSVERNSLIDAQAVVDSAIAKSRLHILQDAIVNFDFRNRTYSYKVNEDQFEYTRLLLDSTGTETYDVLTNEGLTRFVNGVEQQLLEERRIAYSNSVNSVIYFAFLPYRLNDIAVNKQYLGKVRILEKNYYKIKVTFSQEGGGEDFEDVFIYWFDTEDYSMDFLAYEYLTNGGGVRFREATNTRDINGIRIQDYINYKPPKGEELKLIEIDRHFEQGNLEKLSTIDLKNLTIITNTKTNK
ncbi:MAG: DUF6503 family protein [Cyclobacteriaceae bacterium]